MTDSKKDKILIVDDMPNNLTILSRILTGIGYEVNMANNGKEAIESTKNSLPDLILLDINMPVMDGFEACAKLKVDEKTKNIPVIFLSVLDGTEDKVKAFRIGAADYIPKPFELEEVLARVEAHLAVKKLRVQLQSVNEELSKRVKELAHSQAQLSERERKLSAFIDAMPNLSFVFNEEGRYLEVLTNEISLLPAKVEDLKGRLLSEIIPSPAKELIIDVIQRTIDTGKIQAVEYKTPVLAGGEHWFEGRVALMEKDDSGHSKVVFIATEITERVRLYQEVKRLATQDPLTNCFNRRHFLALAEEELVRITRYHHPISLLMLDIDHFKNFNDKYGHPTGDQLLCVLVNLCRERLRNVDILGRYGGEEFVILLPETDSKTAQVVAERLRKDIEEMKMDSQQGKLSITVSIGVASLGGKREMTDGLDFLIKQADQTLYSAKTAGRNCVRAQQ